MRKLTLMFLVLFTWCAVSAVPAKPGFRTHTQSDGTTIQVQVLGDEWHHSAATSDRLTIALGEDGDYYYRDASGLTTVKAHNPSERTSDERAFVTQNADLLTLASIVTPTQKARRASAHKARRKVGTTQVPTSGSPKVPILLVEYTDKKMSNSLATFQTQYTSGSTSVFQYFKDQSNGLYTPQFDVYGIYPLNNNRATYGGNDSNGDDKGVAKMVNDAIVKAGSDIDWSQYDNDGDGYVDVCIIVYAGVGEAQAYGVVPNAVWPCQWELSDAVGYGDGSGALTRNGVTIDKFAVFNEINGDDDDATIIDGIGTFCHEFSHCLGLPDFYETTYTNGYFGMSYWSLMDTGCYNGGSVSGDTPIGYSAYEKNFMSWIDYITPVENTQYTLDWMNQKQASTDQAIKVTSPLNSNEYYVLENRKKQGWDAYIDDEGLMVTHVTYIEDRWTGNTVNNEKIQLFTIIPADNALSEKNLNKDLYGETNHELTDTSTPAANLNMKANGSLANSAGGAGKMGKPITEINLANDGKVSLWYMKASLPALNAPTALTATDVTSTSFTANWSNSNTEALTYTLQVSKKGNYTSLLTEDFSALTPSTTDVSESLDDYTSNAGWTGYAVYPDDGCLKLGASRKIGTLTTPSLDLSASGGKVTVKVNAASYSGDNASLVVTCGSSSQTVTLTEEMAEYTVLLDCTAAAGQNITFSCTGNKKRVFIYDLEIFSGNASSNAPARASETGDANSRTITGITGTSYTVENLSEGETYTFKVKAVPADGVEASESAWSETATVTLADPDPTAIGVPTIEPGSCEISEAIDVTITAGRNGVGIAYRLGSPDGTSLGEEVVVQETEVVVEIPAATTVLEAYTIGADGERSEAATATYTYVEPVEPGDGTYARIITAADLAVGDKFLLVCEDKSSAAAANLQSTELTLADGFATLDEESTVSEFTLGGESGAYTLSVGNKYLQMGASGTGLSLSTMPTTATLAQWTITFDGNNAVITNVNTGRQIYAYQAHDFRGYKSTSGVEAYPVQLYKQSAEQPATIGVPTIEPGSCEISEAIDVTITAGCNGVGIAYRLGSPDGTSLGEEVVVQETEVVVEIPAATIVLEAYTIGADGERSEAATATYTYVEPVEPGDGDYIRITTTDELTLGDKYIIVCEQKSTAAAVNLQSNNLTIAGGVADLTADSDVTEFVLQGESGAYTLVAEDSYLQIGATSGTALSLLAMPETETLAQWDITFDGNDVVIVNITADNARQIYAYQDRDFRAYKSTGSNTVYAIQLYKYVEKDEPGLAGDVNGDGSVNAGDVSAIYNVMLGLETNETIIALSDVNGDGSVNAGDVSAVYVIMLNGE